ncbi:MAG TPA: HAMP domain-containing sensor histidine kinase [Clostridia bacterium]|nr:HAMP domain-containing sensor histidine kinase [Clostridia bacterium]
MPFLWAIGCVLGLVVILAAVAGAVATALLSLALGTSVFSSGPGQFAWVAALVFVVLVAAVGLRGIRRMTAPMDNLIQAARRIERGDYSASVPEYGPPEMRSVARAFNAMSARLKLTDEQRRSFLADVAHELRTPLSVIRGQAEGISDGIYPADALHIEPILEATRGLEVLVEDLRTLVLTDAGSLVLNRELIDPTVLVHDVLASFKAQAEAAEVNLAGDLDYGVPMVDVDPARMRSAIANVISNAMRHTPPGGLVRVGVQSAADQVIIGITDTGEGIPAKLLPRVFERFVKAPTSTGSGLGLAIVHDIVTAHGGKIEIESTQGVGTAVRITLQAASAPVD